MKDNVVAVIDAEGLLEWLDRFSTSRLIPRRSE